MKKHKKIFILIILFIVIMNILSCVDTKAEHTTYILKEVNKKERIGELLIDDSIITIDGNNITCLNTAGTLWKRSLKNPVIAAPATDGKYIYVVTDHELVSMDITKGGKEVWRKENTNKYISEVYYRDGNLYLLGAERFYSIASLLEKDGNKPVESVGQVHVNQILDFKSMINTKIGVVFHGKYAFLVVFNNRTNTYSDLVGIEVKSDNLLKLWTYNSKTEINSIIPDPKDYSHIYILENNKYIHKINIADGTRVSIEE